MDSESPKLHKNQGDPLKNYFTAHTQGKLKQWTLPNHTLINDYGVIFPSALIVAITLSNSKKKIFQGSSKGQQKQINILENNSILDWGNVAKAYSKNDDSTLEFDEYYSPLLGDDYHEASIKKIEVSYCDKYQYILSHLMK